MQKDKKLIQFQDALLRKSSHPIDLDLDFDFEDLNPPAQHQPPPPPPPPPPRGLTKNKTNVQGFLESIDSSTFELMRKYLQDNQNYLNKPVPPKIGLYEDIKIIYEFKRGEAEIALHKGKGKETISERLAFTLRRSKSTIFDRMKKKLYKLSIEEIHYAILTNTPFNFDKKDQKSKSTVPSIGNSRVERQQTKRDNLEDDTKVISEEDELSKLGFGPAKFESKFEPRRQKYGLSDLVNDHDRHDASSEKKRIYKYGKRDLKQRILIYSNRKDETIIVLPKSQKDNIKKYIEKEKRQTENPRKETPEKPKEANKKAYQEPKSKEEDHVPKNEEEAPVLKKEEEEDISMQKNREPAPIAQRKEDVINQESKEKMPHPKITDNQSLKSAKQEEKKEQIKQELKRSNDNKQERSFPAPYQQDHSKLLYNLNNDEQTLRQLAFHPQLGQKLIWSEEEDNLLYQFCFNPECNKLGLSCLLRYKTLAYVIKRCKFLNLGLKEVHIDELKKVNARIDEPMDIV